MKKYLLTFIMLAVGMTANAQRSMLDEVELLGTWQVTEGAGIFTGRFPIYNNAYQRPAGFTFNDGKTSFVTWEDVNLTPFDEAYDGYFVTHSSNRVILHIVPQTQGGVWLNFVVTDYDNDKLTLETLSGNGTLYLKKQETDDVQAAHADAPANGRAYTLNGIEADGQTKGILIQDGKKTVRK